MTQSGQVHKHHLLFVDDEEKTCKYFARIFGSDFQVTTATSAEQAWELANAMEVEPAVVVSDQRMPGEAGTALLGRFEQKFPEVIRILTTAYSDLSSAIEAVNIGRVYEYISKPWEIDELRNKLNRAVEVYQLRKDRQHLLAEKVSVVERMVYLDRIRSLSLLATSLSGTVRGPRAALKSYVEQAPLKNRIEFELENAATLDLTELVRLESNNMLHAVGDIRSQLSVVDDGNEVEFDLVQCLENLFAEMADQKREDGMELQLKKPDAPITVVGNPQLVASLFRILVNRLGDMRGEDLVLSATFGKEDHQITVDLAVSGEPWDDGQLSSLFSALMPIQRWPLGQDMDLLSAFFIAHHFGGGISVDAAKPGISATLSSDPGTRSVDCEESKWFSDLLDQLDLWKHSDEFAMLP